MRKLSFYSLQNRETRLVHPTDLQLSTLLCHVSRVHPHIRVVRIVKHGCQQLHISLETAAATPHASQLFFLRADLPVSILIGLHSHSSPASDDPQLISSSTTLSAHSLCSVTVHSGACRKGKKHSKRPKHINHIGPSTRIFINYKT